MAIKTALPMLHQFTVIGDRGGIHEARRRSPALYRSASRENRLPDRQAADVRWKPFLVSSYEVNMHTYNTRSRSLLNPPL
jgi:hypothetical protein